MKRQGSLLLISLAVISLTSCESLLSSSGLSFSSLTSNSSSMNASSTTSLMSSSASGTLSSGSSLTSTTSDSSSSNLTTSLSSRDSGTSIMISSTSSDTSTTSSQESSSLTSSIDNGDYPSIEEVLQTLYSDGYDDLEAVNTPMIRAGREEFFFTTYGLTVQVLGFYEGYVAGNTRWIRIHMLAEVIQAMYVYNKVMNEENVSHTDRLGLIVIETESYQTWALFHPD